MPERIWALPTPGSQQHGEDKVTRGGMEGTSPGVEGAAPPAQVIKVGQERSLLAAQHHQWKHGMEGHLPAHLPSVPSQVVPHPSKTHQDALAPLEKLCLSLLDAKQVFNLHCFVPLFVRLAGTRHKALHPATFSAHQQLEKARTGAQPRSSLFLPLEMQATHNDHILRMASPKYTRHGTVLLACRNCARRALTYSNVTSQIPHQPRSQEIFGTGPKAASLCSEQQQHE